MRGDFLGDFTTALVATAQDPQADHESVIHKAFASLTRRATKTLMSRTLFELVPAVGPRGIQADLAPVLGSRIRVRPF